MGLFDGFFGGGSGGNSSSNTTSIDKRMVVDGSSLGISSDSSTVNLLDAGATKQAVELAKAGDANASKNLTNALQFSAGSFNAVLDFARQNDQGNAATLESLLGFARDAYGSSFKTLDSARKDLATSSDLVAKAYDDAKGDGTQKTTIMIAALAVVALAVLPRIKL